MIKPVQIITAILFTLILSASAYSQCKVSVGWEPWEPYQFKNSSGNLSGVDIEIIKAVFEETGCSVDFREMPWKRQLMSVEDGSLNIAPGASELPERKKYANFSLPYRDESFILFLQKGGNEKYKVTRLEDIIKHNIKLGTVRGFYYGKKLDDAMKNPDFKKLIEETESDETNLKKLHAGRIQAVLIDPFVGYDLLNKMNLINQVEKSSVVIISGTIHIMFSKKSVKAETIKSFNDGLQKLKKSGKINQIISKYLK